MSVEQFVRYGSLDDDVEVYLTTTPTDLASPTQLTDRRLDVYDDSRWVRCPREAKGQRTYCEPEDLASDPSITFTFDDVTEVQVRVARPKPVLMHHGIGGHPDSFTMYFTTPVADSSGDGTACSATSCEGKSFCSAFSFDLSGHVQSVIAVTGETNAVPRYWLGSLLNETHRAWPGIQEMTSGILERLTAGYRLANSGTLRNIAGPYVLDVTCPPGVSVDPSRGGGLASCGCASSPAAGLGALGLLLLLVRRRRFA